MPSFVQQLQPATAEETASVLSKIPLQGSQTTLELTPVTLEVSVGVAPGSEKERWSVKTGQDMDVGKVSKAFVSTTISELASFARPSNWSDASADPPKTLQKSRVVPAETTVWRVSAYVIGLRVERDGDYHLELQDDSGATMIAEIPLPQVRFLGEDNPFIDDIKAARDATDKQFNAMVEGASFAGSALNNRLVPVNAIPQRNGDVQAETVTTLDLTDMTKNPDSIQIFSTRIPPTKVTVMGPAFFDKDHGQVGNAANIIEIHPVLDIEFT